ncbi:Sec-independent protein translocase subunit TatA [Streptomyces noursei]|uniref:Sec-independent protein translocase subunit TatA n=1 Tax=Streptomyces noursei TaxID=1971 RepID=UPI0036D2C4BF
MFRNALEPWHLLILVAVVVLLFGSKKLPDTARALGKSLRILKSETKAMKDDGVSDEPRPTPEPAPGPEAQPQPQPQPRTISGAAEDAPTAPTARTARTAPTDGTAGR